MNDLETLFAVIDSKHGTKCAVIDKDKKMTDTIDVLCANIDKKGIRSESSYEVDVEKAMIDMYKRKRFID